MTKELNLDEQETSLFLLKDYEASGIKGQAKFMKLNHIDTTQSNNKSFKRRSESRQQRHQAGN
jgi:hypothetical protein